jgi:hypothetical protein
MLKEQCTLNFQGFASRGQPISVRKARMPIAARQRYQIIDIIIIFKSIEE